MSVAVISSTGKVLMPTSEYRARKLFATKKAVKYSYNPFTIQLTERENGEIQPVEICVDTGYVHIGVSVKSEKHEYLAMQIDTLTDEKQKHEDRKMYRRNRRSRKRYRITLEVGNFDTQLLKAIEEGGPLPQGTDYQHGERYNIATLREAVFSRDSYTCQCCGRSVKDGAILHAHHITYRSMGGTNSMPNLMTVCDKCHTPANHQPGGKLYGLKPKLKDFKGATFMTTVRRQMLDELKQALPGISINITYGAETKERRRALNISKSHVNDAYVMGDFHPKHRTMHVLYNLCI